MKTKRHEAVRRQLSTLFNIGAIRELTDGQLLERFSTDEGEAAELAFEALVERHGAMVLRSVPCAACKPARHPGCVPGHVPDPGQEGPRPVGPGFAGPVAASGGSSHRGLRPGECRPATEARRARAQKRGEHGRCTTTEPAPSWSACSTRKSTGYPDCYRIPIVLCDLEACSCEEAARRMGCPVGTVKSWRFRGRQRLRERLIRLGLALRPRWWRRSLRRWRVPPLCRRKLFAMQHGLCLNG